VSEPFDVAGWKTLSAFMVFQSGGNISSSRDLSANFRNLPSDPFLNQIFDFGTFAWQMPVFGAQAVVQLNETGPETTVLHFTVYLSR